MTAKNTGRLNHEISDSRKTNARGYDRRYRGRNAEYTSALLAVVPIGRSGVADSRIRTCADNTCRVLEYVEFGHAGPWGA